MSMAQFGTSMASLHAHAWGPRFPAAAALLRNSWLVSNFLTKSQLVGWSAVVSPIEGTDKFTPYSLARWNALRVMSSSALLASVTR